jgi:hypothetical protein
MGLDRASRLVPSFLAPHWPVAANGALLCLLHHGEDESLNCNDFDHVFRLRTRGNLVDVKAFLEDVVRCRTHNEVAMTKMRAHSSGCSTM